MVNTTENRDRRVLELKKKITDPVNLKSIFIVVQESVLILFSLGNVSCWKQNMKTGIGSQELKLPSILTKQLLPSFEMQSIFQKDLLPLLSYVGSGSYSTYSNYFYIKTSITN